MAKQKLVITLEDVICEGRVGVLLSLDTQGVDHSNHNSAPSDIMVRIVENRWPLFADLCAEAFQDATRKATSGNPPKTRH